MNIEQWKKRKKELCLTHDALALKSGISRRTIAGIFSGDPNYSTPTYNTVQAIERALGITDEPTEQQLSNKEERLLNAFNALIPPMQDYILEMTETLVEKQEPQTSPIKTGKKHA